jgi:hypothetical protein
MLPRFLVVGVLLFISLFSKSTISKGLVDEDCVHNINKNVYVDPAKIDKHLKPQNNFNNLKSDITEEKLQYVEEVY